MSPPPNILMQLDRVRIYLARINTDLIRTLNQTKDTHIKHMLRSRIETLSAELGHPIPTTKSHPDLFNQT